MNSEKQMIGYVACLECGGEWSVTACENTLYKLECPFCGEQNSKPLEEEE